MGTPVPVSAAFVDRRELSLADEVVVASPPNEETGRVAGLLVTGGCPDQVAEQVRVGLVLVPLKLAWKPKEVLPPAAMAPL